MNGAPLGEGLGFSQEWEILALRSFLGFLHSSDFGGICLAHSQLAGRLGSSPKVPSFQDPPLVQARLVPSSLLLPSSTQSLTSIQGSPF